MKKTLNFLAIAAFGIIAVSCGPRGDKAEASDSEQSPLLEESVSLNVNLSNSIINWVGAKPTGEHNGTIKIKEGTILMDKGEVAGGSFVIDMNSIVNLDLTDAGMNAKLVGHLKSPDFFDVNKYPIGTFEITNVEKLNPANENASHKVTGNLTLKDISKSISFLANLSYTDGVLNASTAQFKIDRTQWNVQYGSLKLFPKLKDQFINDEFALVIQIQAQK